MGSTRLPDKVLREAAGRPLLQHLLGRLERCESLDCLVVATTTEARDDAIAELCERLGVLVYRGSEEDVLDRHHQAAQRFGLDVIVRVTSDCPLVDPELIDPWVDVFVSRRHELDLVTNRHPPSFIDGLDFDVMSRESLEFVWRNAKEPRHREHTVPYFWDSGMRVLNFEDPDRGFWRHRWTLDYPEDFELIRRIIEALGGSGFFGTRTILDYLARHPDVARINARYLPAEPTNQPAGAVGSA